MIGQVRYLGRCMFVCVYMSGTESHLCLTLCDPMDYTGHRILQARIVPTGMGCLSLLQGIFPTQGSNSGLLYCRQTLYQLSYHLVAFPLTDLDSFELEEI